MRRTAAVLLATALLGVTAPASAQSEAEVEAAREELERTRLGVLDASSAASATYATLLAQVADFNAVSRDLEQTTFAFAALQEDVIYNEETTADRKEEVASLVRDLYGVGSAAVTLAAFSAPTVDEAYIAEDLLARISVHRSNAAEYYEEARRQLEAARDRMEAAAGELTALREAASQRVNRATFDAVGAAERLDLADAAAQDALDEYEAAVDRLEAALASVHPRVLRWRPLVLEYFPEELSWQALQMIQCESSGRPEVKNPEADAVGLFQFLPGVWTVASTAAGFEGADRTDPEANVAAAAWVVQQSIEERHPDGPWGRWSCKPRGG